MEFSLDDLLFPGDDDDSFLAPDHRVDENMGLTSPDSSSQSFVESIGGNPPETLPGLHQSQREPGFPYTHVDWDAAVQQAQIAATESSAVASQDEFYGDFTYFDQNETDWQAPSMQTSRVAEAVSTTTTDTSRPLTTIDDFFMKSGASRPPVPCTLCQRRRLQCLILQTTQVNPNPTKSCSSCVALFRECSLSGSEKRQPSAFETSQPVIGGLHGVSEDTVMDRSHVSQDRRGGTPMSHLSEKRPSTRSVRKTRVLRNWFINHLDSPYPSEEDKQVLGQQSGLSKSQVVNWFANARRRQRVSENCQRSSSSSSSNYQSSRAGHGQTHQPGSPMPQSLLQSMSPLDRWRSSPPEEEAVSASAIQQALASPPSSGGSSLGSNYQFTGMFDAAPSSTSDDSLLWQQPCFTSDRDSSNNSAASSCYSHTNQSTFRHADASSSGGATSKKTAAFQCTFCRHPFKKKYDWVRHERSVHLPGVDAWICSPPVTTDDDGGDDNKPQNYGGTARRRQQPHLVWRVGDPHARCVFCGEACPDGGGGAGVEAEHHLRSHEFEACAERSVQERSFARKDHLRQHLRKFHGCRDWGSVDGDKGGGVSEERLLLRRKQQAVKGRCGFCRVELRTWDERMEHLAAHFKAGLTMEGDWIWEQGAGISDDSLEEEG